MIGMLRVGLDVEDDLKDRTDSDGDAGEPSTGEVDARGGVDTVRAANREAVGEVLLNVARVGEVTSRLPIRAKGGGRFSEDGGVTVKVGFGLDRPLPRGAGDPALFRRLEVRSRRKGASLGSLIPAPGLGGVGGRDSLCATAIDKSGFLRSSVGVCRTSMLSSESDRKPVGAALGRGTDVPNDPTRRWLSFDISA